MFRSLTIIALFLSQSLFAVDLNIYNSVTEIRKAQNGAGSYQYYFTSGEYGTVVDGSITWTGTPFVKQELYTASSTLKNAIVTVYPTSQCDCKATRAKIIDPNTMLLQNLNTQGYFYGTGRIIEYVTARPDDGGMTLRFEFSNNKNYNGTLSYLMRGINWSPSYDLFYQDDKNCDFKAYATIRNNQEQDYQVDNTYLNSGDLQLANSYPYGGAIFRAPQAFGVAMAAAPASSIQAEGESKGFYFYSLNDKYTLRSKSSIRLPFVTVNAGCKFSYQTTTSISIGSYNGIFQRNYEFTSDKFLPAGVLTVRDSQVLMGQSNLPDVPANYTQKIALGDDRDVQYLIKGTIVASSNDTKTSNWQTYRLIVTISNYKDKDVTGQLAFYAADKTSIESTTCASITVDGNIINLPFQLPKSDNYQCHFTATLNWG